LQRSGTNHYATLGLDRRCSDEQIRAAYRVLARQHHPDLNPDSAAALYHTQEINAAYEVLGDPERRRSYDESLAAEGKRKTASRAGGRVAPISQDVLLRLEEFFRGTSLEVRVNDPGNPDGPEVYALEIPPATAPGARFRIRREGAFGGGLVLVRLRTLPDFRFKVRGSDLRCELRITHRRAVQGGSESLRGVTGNFLRVPIPPGVARGEVLRIQGEGLPKPRGGRGDLLVRVAYTPDVRITRAR
jgi:DnaJ-class molecular chaperone